VDHGGAGRTKYFALSGDVRADKENNLRDIDNYSASILELPNPGHNYDTAVGVVHFASLYRLSRGEKGGEEALSMAYLKKLGFEILRVDDYVRIFGLVEDFS